MQRLYSRFWVSVTVLLCVIFAVLFYPETRDRYGVSQALLFTAAGIAVIWIVYLVRAYIFSRLYQNERRNTADREAA